MRDRELHWVEKDIPAIPSLKFFFELFSKPLLLFILCLGLISFFLQTTSNFCFGMAPGNVTGQLKFKKNNRKNRALEV